MQPIFLLSRQRTTDRRKSTRHPADNLGRPDWMVRSVVCVEKVQTLVIVRHSDARTGSKPYRCACQGTSRGRATPGASPWSNFRSRLGPVVDDRKAVTELCTTAAVQRHFFRRPETPKRLHIPVQKSAVRPCIRVKPSWLSPRQTYLSGRGPCWQLACFLRHLDASL